MAVDVVARSMAAEADSKAVTAYQYAVAGGYTGTEQEFQEEVALMAENARAVNNAVRFDLSQEKTDEEKLQAQSNIGVDTTKGALQAQMNEFAKKKGYYGEMGVAYADNLNGNEPIIDTAPYAGIRPTGGENDVSNFLKMQKLVGGSLVWNQLVQNGNFASSSYWGTAGGTTEIANNKCTFTASSGATAAARIYQSGIASRITLGHVHFVSVIMTSSINNRGSVRLLGKNGSSITLEAGKRTVVSAFLKPEAKTEDALIIYMNDNAVIEEGDTCIFENVNVVDLTALLTADFADAVAGVKYAPTGRTTEFGINWLYKQFPKLNGGYYAYAAPHFEHARPSKHTNTELNLFRGNSTESPQYVGHYYINAQGYVLAPNNNYNLFRIRVEPNTTYAMSKEDGTYLSSLAYTRFLDINGEFISGSINGYNNATVVTRTTPANCYYIEFSMGINFDVGVMAWYHYDNSNDDNYEDYEAWEYDLGDDVLKGFPVLDLATDGKWYGDWHWSGDEKTPDGTITKKWAEYTFTGNESWQYVEPPTWSHAGFRWTSPSMPAAGYVMKENADVRMVEYISVHDANWQNVAELYGDKVIGTIAGYVGIVIRDDSITSLADFKTYITGKKLLYELATPTTESGDAYDEEQACHNWGTQWFTDYDYEQNTRDFEFPQGHQTEYKADLTEKLEALANAPIEQGTYDTLVDEEGMKYVPATGRLPAYPTTGTKYNLELDLTPTPPTLAWVAEE